MKRGCPMRMKNICLAMVLFLLIFKSDYSLSGDDKLNIVNFVPEYCKCVDDKDRLNIAKIYMEGLKDDASKNRVYKYLYKIENRDYYHSVYELVLKEGKKEWAFEYLFGKGMESGLVEKWAFDELMKLNDDELKSILEKRSIINFTVIDFDKNPSGLKEWHNIVKEALPNLADSDEKMLIESVNNKNPWVRLFALNTLNEKKGRKQSILPLLIECIKDNDSNVADFSRKKLGIFSGVNYGNDYIKWKAWMDKVNKEFPKNEISSDEELMDGYEKSDDLEIKLFSIKQLYYRIFVDIKNSSKNKSFLERTKSDTNRKIGSIAESALKSINKIQDSIKKYNEQSSPQ